MKLNCKSLFPGKLLSVALLFFILLMMTSVTSYGALILENESSVNRGFDGRLYKPTAIPATEVAVHKVGNIHLTITNYGFFGSQNDPSIVDPETDLPAESCVYPAGSDIEYLFQGALWIGAIVNDDTLVSTGHDGWQSTTEMYPDEAPEGSIIKRSIRKTDPSYSPEAVSEADYIAVFTDTLTDQSYVPNNPDDNRGHIPIGLEITQKSYSWSFSYAEDFVIFDFLIKNIGINEIRKAYVGIYIDADVGYGPRLSSGGLFQDDIAGFKHVVPSQACPELDDSILIAWIADNDGDPESNTFTSESPVAVTGTRVVRTPNPDLNYSFNWWVSQGNASLDWGPIRVENNRDLGTGGLGTPAGDANKYFFMSNNEFDYDQLWAAVDFSDDGWLPPNGAIGKDLADGYDTRYLLSFGPFDISVGDSLPVTIAYIAGDKFHVKPDDFQRKFNENEPQLFYDALDFKDLGINSIWAAKVYDNPGVDTDGDGYAGEVAVNPCTGEDFFITGDGEPDFAGPPPPSPPIIRHSALPGEVTIRWNGRDSELEEDPFSFKVDFEGYRVYIAREAKLSSFSLVTSFDFLDFDRIRLNYSYAPPRWELTEAPFSLDELYDIYRNGDEYNEGIPDFHPDHYPDSDTLTALEWMEPVGSNGAEVERTKYYFRSQDFNRAELNEEGTISKTYPDADTGTWIFDEELGEWLDAYYEYEYHISGLLPSQPVYVSVTTLDFGDPTTSLGPLESSPLANAVEIYPVYSADKVAELKLDVQVFPNPYKGDGRYLAAGYEKISALATNKERARRIHFMNLPERATIRIFTLDGDLVRQLEHPCNCPFQEGESMMSWDLISKNTQAIVSGIYLYSIESELGSQVGKLVIIR